MKYLSKVISATFFLFLCAQVQCSLPFTPVPITLQTFAVMLISLLLARGVAVGSVLLYLILGFSGLPVFSQFSTAAINGKTSGYLVGMLLSSFFVSTHVKNGKLESWSGCFKIALTNSLCVLGTGALVLGFWLPWSQVFGLGVLPFIPGDIIKSSSALFLARAYRRRAQKTAGFDDFWGY